MNPSKRTEVVHESAGRDGEDSSDASTYVPDDRKKKNTMKYTAVVVAVT